MLDLASIGCEPRNGEGDMGTGGGPSGRGTGGTTAPYVHCAVLA